MLQLMCVLLPGQTPATDDGNKPSSGLPSCENSHPKQAHLGRMSCCSCWLVVRKQLMSRHIKPRQQQAPRRPLRWVLRCGLLKAGGGDARWRSLPGAAANVSAAPPLGMNWNCCLPDKGGPRREPAGGRDSMFGGADMSNNLAARRPAVAAGAAVPLASAQQRPLLVPLLSSPPALPGLGQPLTP